MSHRKRRKKHKEPKNSRLLRPSVTKSTRTTAAAHILFPPDLHPKSVKMAISLINEYKIGWQSLRSVRLQRLSHSPRMTQKNWFGRTFVLLAHINVSIKTPRRFSGEAFLLILATQGRYYVVTGFTQLFFLPGYLCGVIPPCALFKDK